MSADNYYLIRRHPRGGFIPIMGFASDEDYPEVPAHLTQESGYLTIDSAMMSVMDEYTEYGVVIHQECRV